MGKYFFKISSGRTFFGAGNTRRFFSITFPLLPSIGRPSFYFFALHEQLCNILVLGGGIRYTTIEVLIYQLARIELDFSELQV
ncbi:MAG: hypothetical protein Ct9H300mP28_36010 [Pseudomonadota bacterium]|nr:MAG: hypothetical protein Ct9H300mP28_36010 [Pseudomonadota bacterium]